MKVLITGKPGSGKSTLVARVLSRLSLDAGGFTTAEIRERGERVGFEVRDVASGRRAVLAHVGIEGGPRVGRYGVDVPAFDSVATPAIDAAIGERSLIVLDEIGRMELFSSGFRQAVSRALDSGKPVLGVISIQRDPFLDTIRARKDISVVTLLPTNRHILVDEILSMLTWK